MPRFFIHLFNSIPLCDEQGEEFDDLHAAIAAAREGASELIAEQINRGEIVDLGEHLVIADDQGNELQVLRFADFFSWPTE